MRQFPVVFPDSRESEVGDWFGRTASTTIIVHIADAHSRTRDSRTKTGLRFREDERNTTAALEPAFPPQLEAMPVGAEEIHVVLVVEGEAVALVDHQVCTDANRGAVA